MKIKYVLTFGILLVYLTSVGQVSYSGNGNDGFGSTVGGSTLLINDDGTTISFSFSRGGSNLDNAIVIYIDSKSGGFNNTSNFTDNGDALRSAVSAFDGTNRTIVNFPSGFTADYAIALDKDYAGLWELINGGSHSSITSANLNPTADASSTMHTFDVDFSEIGITLNNNFNFVASYTSTTIFYSDEAIGDGISPGNTGFNGSITFSGDRSYPNTWSGATDNDWATGSNWTEGVPGATHNVYIPNVINQPTAAEVVTINKGVIKPGASMIAQSTFTGTLTYERNLGTTNWYLVSSPVSGETIEDLIANHTFATGTDSNIGLAPYLNNGTAWDYQTLTSTGSLTAGGGYSVKLATAGDISFTGTMPTADVGVSITSNTNGFNLVGNPYPSFIAANNLADATNNILKVNDTDSDFLTESTIWLWDQATGTYDQVNHTTSFFIAPGQGFFVSANGTQTLSITEDMQSHQSGDSFQRSASTRPEIQLVMTDGTTTRDADIFYINGTTTGFDNGYDSSIFGGVANDFAVYTHAIANGMGRNLGIQSLPNTNYEDMVIPIGVNANAGTNITFTTSIQNLPQGLKVILEDTQTNSFTQLDVVNGEYNVTLDNTLSGIGRFYLHTTAQVLGVGDLSANNISIYTSNDNSLLNIIGLNNGKASLYLFDLTGKRVFVSAFYSNRVNTILMPELNPGIYFVKLKNQSGTLNKKILID